jgi:hypothetical protein
MSVLDPDSLPALLYQLTSVIRKCGGASQKLRAMVLRATAEVSVCAWVGACVLVCMCGYSFIYMCMHVIDMCLGLNCVCLSVCLSICLSVCLSVCLSAVVSKALQIVIATNFIVHLTSSLSSFTQTLPAPPWTPGS